MKLIQYICTLFSLLHIVDAASKQDVLDGMGPIERGYQKKWVENAGWSFRRIILTYEFEFEIDDKGNVIDFKELIKSEIMPDWLREGIIKDLKETRFRNMEKKDDRRFKYKMEFRNRSYGPCIGAGFCSLFVLAWLAGHLV